MDPEILARMREVESALIVHEVSELEETAMEAEAQGERWIRLFWAAGTALGFR